MSISELTSLIPPPANPVECGNKASRRRVEAKLGLRLPDDLFELIAHYGSGQFLGSLYILNPFSPKYEPRILAKSQLFNELRSDPELEWLPFDIWPQVPGILPCGGLDSGDMIHWLTEGPSNEWPLVLHDPKEHEFQVVRRPITGMLADFFSGRAQYPVIGLDKKRVRQARKAGVELFESGEMM